MALGVGRRLGILDDGSGLVDPLREACVRDMVGDAFGSDLRTSRYELAPEYFVSVRRAHVPLVGVKEVAGAADAAGFMGKKVRELDLEQGSILVFESCHRAPRWKNWFANRSGFAIRRMSQRTAIGATVDPVPPCTFSGCTMNANSWTPFAASSSSFMFSSR